MNCPKWPISPQGMCLFPELRHREAPKALDFQEKCLCWEGREGTGQAEPSSSLGISTHTEGKPWASTSDSGAGEGGWPGDFLQPSQDYLPVLQHHWILSFSRLIFKDHFRGSFFPQLSVRAARSSPASSPDNTGRCGMEREGYNFISQLLLHK